MKSYIVLSIFRYVLIYIAYNPLICTILTCIFFIIFTIINLTAGDLTLIGIDKITNFIGHFGFITKENYGNNDILKFFSSVSLVLTIISVVLSKIYKSVTKKDFVVRTKTRYYVGVGTITLLMLIAQLSIFIPNANNGARSLWPVLLIFWIISLVCYVVYSIISALAHKLEIS